jgi:hypothetical protein
MILSVLCHPRWPRRYHVVTTPVMNFANVNTALVTICNLCNVSGTIQENMLCRVPVHLLEAEQELDGLVRAADLLHPLDLESVEYRVTRRLGKEFAKFFKE